MGGFISEDKIEEIRATSDIFEVISGYITLNKAGKNYKGLCPFHQEKTPSFTVSPEKQIFHCFGCGEGGNVFSFLMKQENISFPEAVLSIAKRYGIKIKPASSEKRQEFTEKRESLYEVNLSAYNFFRKALKETGAGKVAIEYLKKRGITDDSIENFHIGYSLPEWDSLLTFLKKHGFSEEVLLDSGLVVSREKKSSIYDMFRNRIIFPILNINGKIIGFGGRNLDNSLPKYINSPETLIYKKGETLYALHIAKDKIKSQGYCIIMEGYIDVLIAHKFGFDNSVASLGTAMTEKQLRIIKGLTDKIVFVFDSDRAGINAVLRAWEGVLKTGLNGKVVVLPAGEDPDTFLRKKGKDAFKTLIKDSRDMGEYIIDRTIEGCNLKTSSDKSQAITKILKILEPVMCLLRLADYSSYLANKLGINEEFLFEAIKYDKKKDITSITFKEKNENFHLDSLEVYLIQLMLVSREVAAKVFENISSDDFEDPLLKRIFSAIEDLHGNDEIFGFDKIMNIIADEKVSNLLSFFFFQTEHWQNVPDLEKASMDCIRKMQKRKTRKLLNDIEKELKSANVKGDESRLNELLEKKYKLYTFLKDVNILEN